MDLAKPEIFSRMAAYEEDQIEFSILGLVKDPLVDLTSHLARNVKYLSAIDEQLSALGLLVAHRSAPRSNASAYDTTIYGPDLALDLTQKQIDLVDIPEDIIAMCKDGTSDELRRYQQELIGKQQEIQESIKEEQQARRADEDHAASRRHDYGPAVHTWVRLLARKKMVEELLGEM